MGVWGEGKREKREGCYIVIMIARWTGSRYRGLSRRL